jgi:hypothetical protein
MQIMDVRREACMPVRNILQCGLRDRNFWRKVMQQDRLNFFEPYEHLPPYHENQLTRALLVVLRYCPIAHQAWLSLIDAAASSPLDPRLPALHSLSRPTFETQRAQILRGEDQPKTNEPIKGLGVFCAADASNGGVQGAVLESDRGQVLDGIIRYGDERVIVLESKLHEMADDTQARNINLHGQPILFEGPVRKISWRNILSCFTDLADENRGVVSGAEREILNDFLTFIDKNFAQLGPFNTLRRCAGEPSRVRRRLDTILREFLEPDGTTIPGTHTSVKLARLDYDGEKRLIKLRMWPADTLQQARSFYGRPKSVERLLKLQNHGWTVSPNFHFGFMASGYCWSDTSMPVAEYMQYWLEHIGDAGQIERQDWNEYWSDLVKVKIAKATDREEFDLRFTNTDRNWASPRPGLACEYVWNLDEAERLDDVGGKFAKAVRERVNQLLEAIGEGKINTQ